MNALESKPQRQSSQQPYPLNCWWVAATTEEVARQPISRWLLERRVVLFRTGDGVLAALEDRCAHRWAPLSQGRLIGDEIACPYHGFRYNTRGACTHVPTQSHISTALKVRTYPVREHGLFVWIWLGDPTRADPALLPPFFWSTDPAYMQSRGYMEVRCSYMAVQENLMDKAHADYLHRPDRDWLQPAFTLSPDDVQVIDGKVTTVVKDVHYYGPLESMDTREPFNVSETSTFIAPGCWSVETSFEHLSSVSEPRGRVRYGVHCTTPITPVRCHWWWAYIQNFGHSNPRHFPERVEGILKQDKDVLEAIQMTIDQNIRGESASEIPVKADRSTIAVRRTLQNMLQADSE